MGRRLRALIEADLAVRGGDAAAAPRLRETARTLATELDGLRVGGDLGWLVDLVDELGWLVGDDDERPDRLPARLQSERYLGLLDALVGAARAPRLGERGSVAADEELALLLGAAVAGLAGAVEVSTVDAPPAAWADLALRFRRLESLAALAAPVLPARAGEVDRRLAAPRRRLDAVCVEPWDEEAALAAASDLDPAAAFAAGRAWERRVGESRRARQAFLGDAARATRKLARSGSSR